MTLTARDKILVILLPAILIVLGYGVWFGLTRQSELTGLERGLANAEKAIPSPEKAAETNARVRQLVPRVKQLDEYTRNEQQRWETLAGLCADPAKRNERREKLTTLLAHNGLSLLEDGPLEGGNSGKDIKLSAALEAMAKQLGERSPGRQPQLWQLRLYGRYPNLCHALEELAAGDVLAIPVGLSMKEAKSGHNGREWVLLVWI